MENDIHRDAVDVLRDALTWRLAKGSWAAVERWIRGRLAMREALAEAVQVIRLAGPIPGPQRAGERRIYALAEPAVRFSPPWALHGRCR
jgi:hypothetical protein